MTIPAFIFGTLIACILSCGFHLWRGGNLGKLLVYLVFGVAGFWLGHLLGQAVSWTFLRTGAINLGMGVLGCLAFLGFGFWLTWIQPEKEGKRSK